MGATIGRELRTIPNIITLTRIMLLCVGVIVYFYVSAGTGIIISVLAGMTDYLDGYIARRTKQVTRLGEILDQFSDLCFESFVIILATVQSFFPPYVIFLYLFREFWVLCMRRFSAGARINIPSSIAGKAKTNLIMWSFLFTFLSISGIVPEGEPYLGYAGKIIIGVGLVFGYYSALGYTKAFATGYAQAASRID
jgi:CDP-diacylglycerol--glycerol-3-phosphate 3-phosphatidyltransferase